MMDITKIINYLEYAWARRKSKFGLLLFTLGCWILILFLSNRYLFSFIVELCLYIVAFGIVFPIWMSFSGRWIFNSKEKILIGFSLRSLNSHAQAVIRPTIELLKTKLDQIGVEQKFKIIELGTDIVNSSAEAKRFAKKHKLNLLIHGNVWSGNVAEKSYQFDLSNFFFVYHLENIPSVTSIRQVLHADMTLFTQNRDWIIDKTNDLKHVDRVASNLMEIILSTIAFGLAFNEKHIEKSITLIESLLPILEKRAVGQQIQIKTEHNKQELLMPIDVLRSGRLRTILSNVYIGQARKHIANRRFDEAIQFAEKGVKGGADKINGLAAIAIAYFFLSKYDMAEKAVDKIGSIDLNNSIYLVDKAYFLQRQKKYSEALKKYICLTNCEITDGNPLPIEVIAFLKERLRDNPNEPSFNFSIGFMEQYYGDKKNALKRFKSFLKQAHGQKQYVEMLDYAKTLMN
jgi:tetratricopeptide (TPR) repeat protein